MLQAVLNQLHWLSLWQQAIYKTAVLLTIGQPEHQSVQLTDYTLSHQLQSSDCQLFSQHSVHKPCFQFLSSETVCNSLFELTGFLSRDVSISSWHVSFTHLCPARHLRTCHTLGFGRSKTSTPLVHRQIVCCSTDAQHIWRQKLCCRQATSLEQPPSTLARWRHQF